VEIHFAGLLVIDGDLVASVVNKKLLPGAVVVPENYVEMFHPVTVEFTEAGVPVAVGMILAILFPEQLQRQMAVTLQLLTNGAEVRRFVLPPSRVQLRFTAKCLLEPPVIPVGRKRPGHTGRGGGFQILMYGTLRDLATASDLLLREPEGMQP
jgi:hypothetical protein